MEFDLELQKIGSLITEYRKNKGFTQAQFAQKLGTSQSAVARIEKGEQNLTTQMFGKINKVLGKNVISLASPMLKVKVEGGRVLNGSVEVGSSRNSSSSLLYAALINKGDSNFKNLAGIEEVERILDFFKTCGVDVVSNTSGNITIRVKNSISPRDLNYKNESLPNSLVLLLGSLAGQLKKFEIPVFKMKGALPTSIETHLNSLEQLGLKFEILENTLKIDSSNIKSGEVLMYESSNTATQNVLLLASQIEGKTTIKHASTGHQVVDLCNFLILLGVNITGIGTSTIIVQGNSTIKKSVTFEPMPDPTEAFFYICAGLITKSKITVTKVPLNFIELELFRLKKLGAKFKIETDSNNYFSVTTLDSNLVSDGNPIYPQTFPGISFDTLPYFVALATQVKGRTLIHDWMSNERAVNYTQLNKLGADILLADSHRVFVTGISKLKPAEVDCSLALHPGDVFLLLMLAAKGTSKLYRAFVFNKWYSDMFAKLNKLGAKISTLYEI